MYPWYRAVDTPLESTRRLAPLVVIAGILVVLFDWFALPVLGVAAVVPVFEVLDLLGYALVLSGVVMHLGRASDGE